jgi:hypothetical protein
MLLLLLHGEGFADLRTSRGGSCMHVGGHKPLLSISTSSCTSTSTSSYHFRSHSHSLSLAASRRAWSSGRCCGVLLLWCSGALLQRDRQSGQANLSQRRARWAPCRPCVPCPGPVAGSPCWRCSKQLSHSQGMGGEELQGLSLNLGDLN